jgi:hypothetical protein
MDIEIQAKEANITSGSRVHSVEVYMRGVDEDDMLRHISIEAAIEHYKIDSILGHIEVSNIIDYYGKDALFQEICPDSDFQSLR